MSDLLIKGRLARERVAFSYAVTTDLVTEAIRRHQCDPAAAHIIGRALTAAVLSAAQLSPEERLNLRWSYQGVLRTVLVDAGPDGVARGFITPVSLVELAPDQAALYGQGGTLRGVRFRGDRVLASGTSETPFQDVVDDLDWFHATSDQTETGTAAVLAFAPDPEHPVKIARGLMIHAMPDSDLEQFEAMRQRMRAPSFRESLTRLGETDNLVENLMNLLALPDAGPDLEMAEVGQPVFRCTCNSAKMGDVLRALGYEDRIEIVQKGEPVVVNCRMCNERYVIPVEDCVKLWNNKPLGTSS